MRIAFLSVLLIATASFASDTPATVIRMPEIDAPKPPPDSVQDFNNKQFYIVDSDVPCIILCSPNGVLGYTQETGPITFRGEFVDRPGVVSRRTFPGKFVYEIHILKPGKTELILWPVGAKSVSDVVRRNLNCSTDGNPLPPTPVPPTPIPPVPPVTGKVAKFVTVWDSSKSDLWAGNILGSPAVIAYYKQAGLRHRLIDIAATDNADDEAKAFIAAAQGKPLPYLWTFDSNKNQLTAGECPKTPETFLATIGDKPHGRAMGNNPPNKKLYAWKQFGDVSQPKVPLIPRDKWHEIDFGNYLPPVYDQDGIGQCNACATASAAETARYIAGLPYVHLSAGDLYSQINGGVDQGSTLEDGLYSSMNSGIATAKTVPYLWDKRKHNDATTLAERKLYRVLEAYECPNFDAVVSAHLQGFVGVIGLMWYDNDNPDRDGWLPARGTGRSGGHALLSYGATKRGDTWGLRIRNSWGTSWGIGGNCIIPESRLNSAIGGFWVIRATVQTGTDFPVTPKLTKTVKRNPFDDYVYSVRLAY